MGSHTRCREFRGGAKAKDADARKHQQNHYWNPASQCAKAVEPFSKLQSADVKYRDKRQASQREQQVIVAAIREPLSVRKSKQQASRPEVKHRRKIRKVTHPVGPRREETGEVTEGMLCPDVKTAFLRVTRGKFKHACGERHEETETSEDPYQNRAGTGGCRGCYPTQAQSAGNVEESEIEEAQFAFQ